MPSATSSISALRSESALIPYSCEDAKGGGKPVNAKCETVATLPNIAGGVAASQLNGFFEWTLPLCNRSSSDWATFLEYRNARFDQLARFIRTGVFLRRELAVAQLVVADEERLDLSRQVRSQIYKLLLTVMCLRISGDSDQSIVANTALSFSFYSPR